HSNRSMRRNGSSPTFAIERVTGGGSTGDVSIRTDSMRTGVIISGPRHVHPAKDVTRVMASNCRMRSIGVPEIRERLLSAAVAVLTSILHLQLSSGNCTQ